MAQFLIEHAQWEALVWWEMKIAESLRLVSRGGGVSLVEVGGAVAHPAPMVATALQGCVFPFQYCHLQNLKTILSHVLVHGHLKLTKCDS